MSNKPNVKKVQKDLGTSNVAATSLKVSACMMVKNEQEDLPRCLASIINVVDEVIIVDTGSSDETMTIARSFGDKVKLFEHPWTDDFSLHRNQTLEHAANDWCLIIDADEELILPEDMGPAGLRQVLSEIPMNACGLSITLHDIRQAPGGEKEDRIGAQHASHRLVKKKRVHYRGIIHNQLMKNNPKEKLGFCPQIVLRHYGYGQDNPGRAAKLERTLRMLDKQLKMPAQNLHTEFYLAQAWGMKQDAEKVVEWGTAYMIKKDKKNISGSKRIGRGFYSGIYYLVARNMMKLELWDRIMPVLAEALKERPEDIDIHMCLSDVGIAQKSNDLISAGARAFCQFYTDGRYRLALDHPIFTANEETLLTCLYRLTVVRLGQLVENLRAFDATKANVSPEHGETLMHDIARNWKMSNIEDAMKFLDLEIRLPQFGELDPDDWGAHEFDPNMSADHFHLVLEDEAEEGEAWPGPLAYDPETLEPPLYMDQMDAVVDEIRSGGDGLVRAEPGMGRPNNDDTEIQKAGEALFNDRA